MKPTHCVAAALLALSAMLHAPASQGAIVERVVAVVGERPILLSDLLHRAEPHLARIRDAALDDARRAAAESTLHRELLERMIDERLEEVAAERAHLAVSPDEIDAALRNIATAAGLSVFALVAEAKRQGLAEQAYKDELRRQILEAKLLELRVRGRVRPSEDARAYADAMARARKEWLLELRRGVYVDVRL
jgi:peptidyl-prolyl cis-trans isomerase SurA